MKLISQRPKKLSLEEMLAAATQYVHFPHPELPKLTSGRKQLDMATQKHKDEREEKERGRTERKVDLLHQEKEQLVKMVTSGLLSPTSGRAELKRLAKRMKRHRSPTPPSSPVKGSSPAPSPKRARLSPEWDIESDD